MSHEEINKINKIALTNENYGNLTDGYYTMDELYYHRMILFSVIVNHYDNHSQKSKLHHDGTMFNDYFIVGINTPEGQYTYHYELPYWDYFKCDEIDKAPAWDGHSPNDIDRLSTL